jgi:hypothetical protein
MTILRNKNPFGSTPKGFRFIFRENYIAGAVEGALAASL